MLHSLLSVLLSLLLSVSCYTHDGFSFRVLPSTERCFDEEFVPGSTVVLEYKVLHNSPLDIDCIVTGPDITKQLSTQESNTTTIFYSFPTTLTGTYTFCFDNKKSQKEKKIHMKLVQGQLDSPPPSRGEQIDTSVKEVTLEVSKLLSDFEFLKESGEYHSGVISDSYEKVLWWSICEMIVIVIVNFCYCYYFKRTFEVKRPV
eukprot:TRINITY_DN5517_c0_g1_i2.p1 TRINITY_DN5517_c0_g1~~TRINITY_DN5517_c0_g1_i2.p1  ORF type:complete len:202 (+),score=34.13 TRINITY_DN5517_c0_g1_i2:191-796(+)